MAINNKFIIGTRAYEAVSFDEYQAHKEMYDSMDTAIVYGDTVYPVRSRTDTRPGMYEMGPFFHFKDPEDEEEADLYSANRVINFRDQTNIRGVIAQQNAMRSQERAVLTTPDNIYVPMKLEDDSQAMRGLKQAIEMKHIDLDKYESRFGSNYANDKRILTSKDITLSKLTTMANALDLGLTLTITDKDPEVANPINGQIVVDLLGTSMDVIKNPSAEEEVNWDDTE